MKRLLAAGAVAAAVASASAADPPAVFEKPVRLTAVGKPIDHGAAWGHAGPWVADADGDGVPDLVVGDFSGLFTVYRNTGTAAKPVYAAGAKLKAGGVDAKVPIY
ncbi:MAG: hypothetical protein U0871_29765 [Gemmataceae bacterium]